MNRPPRNPRRSYLSDGTEIPPMTLENMRAHGVRCVASTCERTECQHSAVINVDGLPDDYLVPDIALKLRCSRCGGRQIKTIPNWLEHNAPGSKQ
jgi:hypothetical protein